MIELLTVYVILVLIICVILRLLGIRSTYIYIALVLTLPFIPSFIDTLQITLARMRLGPLATFIELLGRNKTPLLIASVLGLIAGLASPGASNQRVNRMITAFSTTMGVWFAFVHFGHLLTPFQVLLLVAGALILIIRFILFRNDVTRQATTYALGNVIYEGTARSRGLFGYVAFFFLLLGITLVFWP